LAYHFQRALEEWVVWLLRFCFGQPSEDDVDLYLFFHSVVLCSYAYQVQRNNGYKRLYTWTEREVPDMEHCYQLFHLPVLPSPHIVRQRNFGERIQPWD
jgi:hypothetical protein